MLPKILLLGAAWWAATTRPAPAQSATRPVESFTTELRGRVVDRTGKPIPKARVLLWHGRRGGTRLGSSFLPAPNLRADADAEGRFAVRCASESFVISAETDFMHCWYRLAGETQGRREISGLRLSLDRTAKFEGRILDPNGRAVAHHPIQTSAYDTTNDKPQRTGILGVSYRTESYAIMSDADGRFTTTVLAHRKYSWRVEHDRYVQWDKYHSPAGGSLEVKLKAGVEIRGTVVRADGSPALGAVVSVDRPDRDAICDTYGRFTLHVNRFGSGRLSSPPKYSYLRVWDELSAIQVVQPIPSDLKNVYIQLDRPEVIAGRVFDAAGKPAVGVEVLAVGERTMDRNFNQGDVHTWGSAFNYRRHDATRMHTDENGVFRFGNLYRGRFRIQVYHGPERGIRIPGQHTLTQVAIAGLGTTDLVFRLDPEATRRLSFIGTVRDAVTNRPVPECRVQVTNSTGNFVTTNGDADGRFEVSELPAGVYRLNVNGTGYAVWGVENNYYSEGNQSFEIALHRPVDLPLEISDTRGKAIQAGVEIRLANRWHFQILRGRVYENHWDTDENGRVVLPELPREVVKLLIHPTDRGEVIERTVDLSGAIPAPLRIQVAPPADQLELLVTVCGARADTDVSRLRRFWSSALTRRLAREEGAWLIDEPVSITLVTSGSHLLGGGQIRPLDRFDERDGVKSRVYENRSWIAVPDGTQGRSREGLLPTATLTGRNQRMRLRVQARGYRVHERVIESKDLALGWQFGRSTRIVVFLRK